MRHLAVALAVGIMLAAGTGLADQTDEQARTQFKQGIGLYKEGKYDQAAIAFERAYELKPSYKILFNLGQAENELGHYAAALQAYTRYIAGGGDEVGGERLGKVEAEIERLNALVGMIVISCPVEGAKVKVDNEARGKTPLPAPIYVDLGKHEVVVKLGRQELFAEVIKVGGGEQVTVEVEEVSTEGPEPVGEEEGPVGSAGTDDGPDRIWTWVAFAVGGAAAVGAGITGGLAIAKESDLEESCADGVCPGSEWDELDSARTLATTSDVLVGVAVAGVITGVVLFFVEPGTDGGGETVALVPSVMPGGAALSIGGEF